MVGGLVGVFVGCFVEGDKVGEVVISRGVGALDGEAVGESRKEPGGGTTPIVGSDEGLCVGADEVTDGLCVGCKVVGDSVGRGVGLGVGGTVGSAEGATDGLALGWTVGTELGCREGDEEGLDVG